MRVEVLCMTVDGQTRCIHYSGTTDVVAIKFKCCGSYYPCFQCHQECADHQAQLWPSDQWREKAILCGVCGTAAHHPDVPGCAVLPSLWRTFQRGLQVAQTPVLRGYDRGIR